MAGTAMPSLPRWLQKVAMDLGEVNAFVINYYGTMFNTVLPETGFEMNYYGITTPHVVPAE